VSHVSGLVRRTEVIEHRDGGDPSSSRRSPGLTKYASIRLKRGITHDTAFEDWANQVWRLGAPFGSEVALASFRKNLEIELYNEAGQLVIRYKVHRCWVTEYEALPDLEADANAVLLESITLEHEGWERDQAVTEPKEPG
jgi:phage tail-like protein